MSTNFDSLRDVSDQELTGMLRGLPQRKIPTSLSVKLRESAASARARISHPRAPGFWSVWRVRLGLWANDLMRPLALPFAGGVLSALALFAIWLGPTYPLHAALKSDIPLGLTTEAAIRSMGEIGVSSPNVEVDVFLDGGGN